MKKIRIDKLLSNSGFGSRKEVKKIIKSGNVTIDNIIIKDPEKVIDPEAVTIHVNGNLLYYREFCYLMMNKPKGVISATYDDNDPTVIDLLPAGYSHFDLFPVGRLDKDTEGLLILTNDGKLAHKLLSPKKHVPKVYYAEIDGIVSYDDVVIFKEGIQLEDFTAMPSQLNIISQGNISKVEVTIYEGKFHQVKRMFQAVNKKVIYLKRISMAGLKLDMNLKPGEVRELSSEEINLLKQ